MFRTLGQFRRWPQRQFSSGQLGCLVSEAEEIFSLYPSLWLQIWAEHFFFQTRVYYVCRHFSKPLRQGNGSKERCWALAAVARKKTEKVANPLFEKRPKQFGIGGALPPKYHKSFEEKLSNLEDENHVLRQKAISATPKSIHPGYVKPFLDESSTPSKIIAPPSQGLSDSRYTKLTIERHRENYDILSRCIKENLGFKDGKPVAACVIYRCLLHWHAFESERTSIFDFIIEGINEILKIADEMKPNPMVTTVLTKLCNEGSLISITIDNSIQVWNLKSRCLACSLCWESNITAFSIISSSNLMYVGDEYGVISVVKYDAENSDLLHLPYHIPSEAAGFSVPFHQPVVGVLPQPCSSGTRVLIAYQSGLIILWDVLEAQIVIVRGNKVLWLKNEVDNPSNGDLGLRHDASHELEEKEISALCWASCDGSILAVGYIDGDILFWKTSTSAPGKGQQSGSSDQVVKLQLSSAEKRLPVIVLHWWANYKSHRDGDGQLLIYGGNEIASEEVLTVLSVVWSSGMGTIQCLSRVDLSLSGPFADVVITAGTLRSAKTASLFVLTNPGHLQIFEVADLSASESQQEKKLCVSAVNIPPVVPTINPLITVANLFCLPIDEDSSKALTEIFRIRNSSSTKMLSGGTSFPLTGGVCTHLSSDKDYRIWRVYVAGYHDGSVRIWDATYPVLSSLCVLQNEIRGGNAAIKIASVSKLEFCIHTLRLAVGDECGLVRIYDLHSSKETSFHFVTETENEVEQLAPDEGPIFRAAFSFIDSQVQALKFTNSGAKLVAGYECGHIAVLDMNSFSTMFLADTVSCPISMMSVICDIVIHQVGGTYQSGSSANDQTKNLMVILTKDGAVYAIDADNGHLIGSRPMRLSKDRTVVSMHVIESCSRASSTSFGMKKERSSKDEMVANEPTQDISMNRNDKSETENQSSDNKSTQHLEDFLVLICCKDMLHLCTAKHIVQGDKKPICKVKLTKPCCWTTIFVKDDRDCGLILLYQTGEIEIRSIPYLELVKETSLASLLRWNFKANMEKTMSSTETGHLTLVNGSELVFLSVLLSENDYRIPDSLPSLHDEVLAAATKAAITYSLKHKKNPGGGPRLLSGIVKGFKREKLNQAMELACITEPCSSHLEDVFVRNLTPDPSTMSKDYQNAVELNIDDIEIDEPVHLAATSSHEVQYDNRESRKDREKLFNEDSSDIKPRLRTREEILATYRKAGDASSVAGQARNKLLERQEKLQRISKQTEDLRNGAEDFASLANELVKVMENRKWWQI